MDVFRDCMEWEKNHVAAGIVFRINANYLADSLLKEFKKDYLGHRGNLLRTFMDVLVIVDHVSLASVHDSFVC